MALELAPVPYPPIIPAATPRADKAIGELQCEQVVLAGPLIWECLEEGRQSRYRSSLIHLSTSLSASTLIKADYPKQHVSICAHYDSSTHSKEIFSLVVKGMSNSEIAAALCITESTVKFHVGNIFKKVGHVKRSELVADFKLRDI